MAVGPAWIGMGAALVLAGAATAASPPGSLTSVGTRTTPLAARGSVFQSLNPDLRERPDYTAGQASAAALSPDGRTLLVLTSGFNRINDAEGRPIPALSNEYVFIYDAAGPAPKKIQVLEVPNTFLGLGWAPSGERFYVSAGSDDAVLEFVRGPSGFAAGRRFGLGHAKGLGAGVKPETAGLAVSPDGRRLVVANYQNDSVSLVDLQTGRVAAEQDLRPEASNPAAGPRPGGTFPKAVAWTSASQVLVAAQRDREVVSLKVGSGGLKVTGRVSLPGQPVALAVSRTGSRAFAALDNSDAAAVLDPATLKVLEIIPTAGPPALFPNPRRLGGVGTNSIVLGPDGRTLYVTNGGQNALAVVALDDRAAGLGGPARRARPDGDDGDDGDDAAAPPAVLRRAKALGGGPSATAGLIPTGWYPTSAAVSPDGRRLYVVNAKSAPGPNPLACRDSTRIQDKGPCEGANQYVWQLEKAGLLSLPLPSPAELGRLTRQTLANNDAATRKDEAADRRIMEALSTHIRHVLYILKENRTYDQMLGDLPVGDGDPRLAVFGRALTPSHHALAEGFVTLDNFLDSGESSNTGWNWSTAARTTDFTEREAPVNYAGRGLQYDQEGDNRNINVGFASAQDRRAANPATPADPDLLVGDADVAAPDGPGAAPGRGYLWDDALRAGLSIRNWGFYGDLSRYFPTAGAARIPLERNPYAKGLEVFITTKAALRPFTDPYFRGFDQAFPDYWRFQEWKREFEGFEKSGTAPNLMLVRLPHDHLGSFSTAIDGVDTVEREIADNDYALGLMVQTVAQSRFAADTLVVVLEDDAQDGPDHVDAHRSIALFAGPYLKHGAVVSRRYTTVNVLRTIEEVLGMPPLNLNDAMARPMTEIFDLNAPSWSFRARASSVLSATALPIPAADLALACAPPKERSRRYWTQAMAGQDFRTEDKLDTPAFNRALWRGLAPGQPFPSRRGGENLRPSRIVDGPCRVRAPSTPLRP